MRLEMIHFALVGGAHGATGAVHEHRQIGSGLLAQLHEFAESGLEDTFHAAGVVARPAAC